MDKVLETFKKRVQERLDRLGMSVTDLANKLEIAPESIYPYLAKGSSKNPGIKLIAAWANALECDADYLIKEKSEQIDDKSKIESEKLAVITLILALDEKDLSALAGFIRRLPSLQKNKITPTG